MNKKEKIEREIQKTLAQFEKQEQLPPNPYFYTRVQARLNERKRKYGLLPAILKPAMLIVLVGINLGTAFWYLSSGQQQANPQQELAEVFANDLRLNADQNNIFNPE